MARTRVATLVALLPPLALALCGCGGGNLVQVTGQVVENGGPRRLAPGESVQVEFATADDAARPLALGIFVKPDGSFAGDLNDGSERGIPPGKYKVRLNREGTSVKTKIDGKLFKERHPVEVVQGQPVRLTIDLATGLIDDKVTR